jgi:molecular chaperone DnaJ
VSAVKRDYYDVLGVPRDADDEAIRRAYRGLARDVHPDVAEAPDAELRFRELAEAYAVLSKREARLLYDRYGYRGRGNQGFDDSHRFAQGDVARGSNVHVEIELESFEAAEGTSRPINYRAALRCAPCAGRGTIGSVDPACRVCRGTGRRRHVKQLEIARLLQIEPCPACAAKPCACCAGRGTVVGERRIRLRVPGGVEDGSQLRVSGDGNDAGSGSIPGDLLVRVHVLPPPKDPRLVRYTALALMAVAIVMLLYVVR